MLTNVRECICTSTTATRKLNTLTEKSKRADLYAALLEARTEVELVKQELQALNQIDRTLGKRSSLISWSAQRDNLQARYDIHQREVEAVKLDVVAFSAWFERTVKSLSQQLAQG